MPNKFAILRVEKVKTFSELAARTAHNTRAARRGVEHCDPRHPPELLAGQDDTAAAWDARTGACGLDRSKVRKGGTVALEWLATASPDWFDTATPEQVTQWAADSLAFITEQAGGAANVLGAWAHLDETTPHIQILTVPLVQKATKRRGRPPKGKPPAAPSAPSWRLSARDQVGGDRDRLVKLQDDYAAAMSPHGLARGVPRKETGERNRPPSQWRAEQRRAAQAAQEAERQAVARAAAVERVARSLGRPVPEEAAAVLATRRRPRPETR